MSNDNTGLFTVLGIAGVGLLLLGGSKATSNKKYKKPRMSAKMRKKYISKSQETFLFEIEHYDKNDTSIILYNLQALVTAKDTKKFWKNYNTTEGKWIYAKSNDDLSDKGVKIKKGQRLKLYTQNGSKPIFFPTKKDFKTYKRLMQ